ncbi:uncharacterized protein LOC110975003 isoform X2 [Acanthaster planci]|uniref:Uncharacterized protein LOC110975003 isoform X2 n=1 Tax=Acanthaster planci TaxID=133434 RepID=A0A8B7XRZ8_ACAPL|nr:uncharacterized protein LOC110975003 isoform X2 [Acanthaster planci]
MNLSGLLSGNNKLEDIAIIQTIFSANNVPQPEVMDVADPALSAHQRTPPQKEVSLSVSSAKPKPVSTTVSDHAQFGHSTGALVVTNRTYSPLSVQGKQRVVLMPMKSDGEDKPPPSSEKDTTGPAERRVVGRQRMVDMYPMRLPKLSVQQRETGNRSSCEMESGAQDQDTVCCGTTNLKRSRCRQQMSKSTGSTEATTHSTGKPVFYPGSRNLTLVRRRGHRTTPRAGSPMPSLRKPLPPIRRRHHSDICTVCPEVHDWKGLARNPRWYPTAKTEGGRQCPCVRQTDSVTRPSAEGQDDFVRDTEQEEKVEVEEDHEVQFGEDLEKGCEKPVKPAEEAEGKSNWFPERSIAVQESDVSVGDEAEKTKDESSGIEKSPECDAIVRAHSQWLTAGTSLLSGEKDDELHEPKTRIPVPDDSHLQRRLMMEGLDFECDSSTEITFEDDNTLLQAVLLRNHALNYGVVFESGDPNPSTEFKGQCSEKPDSRNQPVGKRKPKHFDDRNRILNTCAHLQGRHEADERTSEATHQGERWGCQMSVITPKSEVIMTSRGQQKVVNSSLVAVGRGQSLSNAKSGEECRCVHSEEVAKEDSSLETLLKREMNRYMHSLRHDTAREKHQKASTSAQNIPVKVQNLTAVSRPITADVSSGAAALTKAVGFIPSLSRNEYESLCRKTTVSQPARFLARAPLALPSITGNPSEMLRITRFNGEVKGMQLARQRERKNKK